MAPTLSLTTKARKRAELLFRKVSAGAGSGLRAEAEFSGDPGKAVTPQVFLGFWANRANANKVRRAPGGLGRAHTGPE